MKSRNLAVIALLALAPACSASSDGGSESEPGQVGEIVPPGKADDYFSSAAQEYTVTGKTFAVADSTCLAAAATSPDAKKRCALQSIGLKNFAVAWFLNQYLLDKHDSPNENWGGFTAMTRPASYEALEISTPDSAGKFTYTFTSEVSGPLKLLDKLPTTACGSDRCFTLEVPVLDNATMSKDEWYRSAPYKAYDPSTYTGEKEKIELRIKPYPRSNDAYLEYQKLFSSEQLAKAGGKLKIGLFVGWDYNTARYDLRTAEELYRWLTEDQKFKSPVSSFSALKLDSGEFTKSIKVAGKTVEVSVQLVHPGEGDPNTEAFATKLKAAMIKAFETRQIVIYEGHAGPLYGFSLSNWNVTSTGELDDSELPKLAIPAGFYQVVLASGCDTYMVADSLYANPVKKNRVDLDIITTTSFSNAAGNGRTAKIVVEAVANQDQDAQLEPKMYGELLRELNQESWFSPLYGVHGIDDNPRANPFANPNVACQPCSTHSDCGGNDTSCVNIGGESRCATKCQTNDDCPQSFTCSEIREGNTITTKSCVPTSLSCG